MTAWSDTNNDPDAFSPWRVGMHTSIAGSLDQAAERAHRLGCTAFQIFSGSPRMWNTRQPAAEQVAALARLRERYDLHPLVIHTNYLINLASPDKTLRERSIEAFRGEISRAVALRADYLVLHPGSHRGSSAEQGIGTLAESIRQAARQTPFEGVSLLIENTCGQGHVLGGTFEQLRDILALLDGLGADCCLDTAHCFAAGMDLSHRQGLERMLVALDRTVGIHRVRVVHANDSRAPLGSHRDRHEHIGHGGIGRKGFREIVNHPALRHKVFILETPLEVPGDDLRNMKVIRSLRAGAGRTTRRVSPSRVTKRVAIVGQRARARRRK
ncbi:MAG: deoxyribonuclease IV [Acidobacteria bacterium]|nr:deoxyribonuclease IV [Acidobacteriota bacterium]